MSRFYDICGQELDRTRGIDLFADSKNEMRQVGRTERGGVTVSTVHLVIDHSFGSGPPLIFETMIFGGEHDQDQWRYSTLDEAKAGHEAACSIAFKDEKEAQGT